MSTEVGRLPIRLKLEPGQAGTRRLLNEHGDRLVCVRYRYDRAGRRRYKTIELIVDEAAWWPGKHKLRLDSLVKIWTHETELVLHDQIWRGGGKWNSRGRFWRLTYRQACKLRLQDRIILDEK